MKKKQIKHLIIILFMILVIACIGVIIWKAGKIYIAKSGEAEEFNTNYFTNVYTSPPTFSSLTVGKWYYAPLTSNGSPVPIYKFNSNYFFVIKDNEDDPNGEMQKKSLFYYKINGSSLALQKNVASITINNKPYATNAKGQVYPTNWDTLVPLGNYYVNLTKRNNISSTTECRILRTKQWVKGESYWRWYDSWGLSSNDASGRFSINNTPNGFYSIPNGNFTENGVTRTVNKISVNSANASIANYPFAFDISSATTYKFWYGSNHTEINENYIDDARGRHVIWAEYNNKISDPPPSGQPDKYTSGNVGVDINNVGSYTVEENNGRFKKVSVNMRMTFYWQSCAISKPFTVSGKTFNTYPSVFGIGLVPSQDIVNLIMIGFPYRASVNFFYKENGTEIPLTVNGCFGLNDVDAGQFVGLKVDSNATIDEVQCIDDSYAWTGSNGETGYGSMDYLALGRTSKDGSGVYDIVGANNFTNAANNVTPPSGYYENFQNYYNIASDYGLESLVTYNISNLNTLDLIVGASKKDEAGVKYFDNIFDIPNNHTLVIGDVFPTFLNEYSKSDTERDGLDSTQTIEHAVVGIKGAVLGRNTIPSPTITLKDADEDDASEIAVNNVENSRNLASYTEVISVKIPFESNSPKDNYYDSFKIEQTLDANRTMGNVSIHYYGETTDLSSYFTITKNNTTHKLTIQANSGTGAIYKMDEFYLNELIVEVELTLPSASSSIWSNANSFTHTASLTITRNNSEYSGVANENITNTSNTATAHVYQVIVNINRDDDSWNQTNDSWQNYGMKAALYQDNAEVYGYSEGTVIDSGSKIRWIGVKEGVYVVYASKSSNAVSTLVSTNSTIIVGSVYPVNYAVQIYGINEDVDSSDNPIGLTFGPATGDNYNNKYVTHRYEETSPGSGVYNVIIVTHTVAANGSETTTESNLTNSASENVTRTAAEKTKYDINMHEMTWAQIAAVSDKSAFLDCMLCGDTKKVEMTLNDTIGSGDTYNQYGDGAGMLFGTIYQYYKMWNPAYNNSDAQYNNSAVGTNVTLVTNEQKYGSNARNAGGYSVSHIRATLIGQNAKTNIGYAGNINLNETNSLYSCLPSSLKNVITAKKVKYVTGTSSSSYRLNDDISDKIWAFSQREMYGSGAYTGTTTEGLGSDGHGYTKFSSTDSKYYISSYNINNATQRVFYTESGSTYYWWLRSPYLGSTYDAYYVNGDGGLNSDYPCNRIGLAFGFCIN